MASYFDLPPQPKEAPSCLETASKSQRKQLENTSLLSPAVTQLLDSLDQEPSDSDSEEGNPSEEETAHRDRVNSKHKPASSRPEASRSTTKSSLLPKKGERSATSKSTQVKVHPEGPRKKVSKPKQPHMARFHSLRSMLFTSNVEHKIEECKQIEAVDEWKSQHDQRQMIRPKTPEQETQKDRLGTRIKTRIRRMTSKEVPTMVTLKESGGAHDFSDRESTASSDAEDEREPWRQQEDDEESINHSDVEELVRWVSRRDPPSDGEARLANKVGVVQEIKEDSGHESLGHSDVDDLVRWVSRRSAAPDTSEDLHVGYSDASTETDSEVERAHDSSENEDADDLVRWISHRDGPNAGPVRTKLEQPKTPKEDDHTIYDSDVPELGRWVKRHDGTSGSSNASNSIHSLEEPATTEPERGRPRSRLSNREQQKSHLTEDDINDLVRWVSRKDTPPSQLEPDPTVQHLKREEEAKQAALGMSIAQRSLSHTDVTYLIQHVKSNQVSAQGTLPTVEISSAPARPGEGESGVLRRKDTYEREAAKPAAQEHLQKVRAEGKLSEGVTEREKGREREGSLGQEDVDELVRWVSRKN